jgi:hypothetical protein
MTTRRPVLQHPVNLALGGLVELDMPHDESLVRGSADPYQIQALAIVPILREPVDIYSAPRPRYWRAVMPTLLNNNWSVGGSQDLPAPTSQFQVAFTQRDFGHRFVPRLNPGLCFELPPVDVVSRSAQ